MARIAWIEDDDATGELADLYAQVKKSSIRGKVPDILRAMSLRPDFLLPLLTEQPCLVPAVAGRAVLASCCGAS
jgi:hypothetical protein